ncbi:MAG TPA: hypothetical protein VFM20_01630, partial [Nitrososphaeraceae archaeon]|nr:hypothetical protein [Nitrososphaeraceae archaeon]
VRRMSEFLTSYPRRINLLKGLSEFIHHEEIQFDHLSLMVKIKKEDLIKTLFAEGFKKVKFENKKPTQIGSGFSKKLKYPWEMHLRLLDLQQGLIAIKAEVEISRRYIQHIGSVRAPVVYEIESILKKHKIEYNIWNEKLRDYITHIVDNHQIKLQGPRLHAMPWRHMIIASSALAIVYALKFVQLI